MALPKETEVLDYPPPNPYVPKSVPQPCRAAREEDAPIGKPTLLAGGDSTLAVSDIWFKQDDQFE